MNKRSLLSSKLGIQIILSVIISMLAALVIYALLSFCEFNILKGKFTNREFIDKNTLKEVQFFQKYIDENNISIKDINKINDWVIEKHNVLLKIYKGKSVIYDSTIVNFIPPKESHFDEENYYINLYDIKFSDADAKIEMFVFTEFKYRVLINYIKLGICFIIFLVILMMLIKKKSDYINLLEDEINILEGGNLDYAITVKGNDELSYLARSIDNMRISFIDRLNEEDSARISNHKLVTAMSHDLRTPLTVLLGLLEILDEKKYSDRKQLEIYIHKSKEKAYQIKQLSDKIFEYFLAFKLKKEELNLERLNSSVINELIEDYIFTLNEKGYDINFNEIDENLTILIDMSYIHRVFDNIFSNILKYADINKTIVIKSNISDEFIEISVKNHINSDKASHTESTNIGLETCRNIMREHDGEFKVIESNNNEFSVMVKIKYEKD